MERTKPRSTWPAWTLLVIFAAVIVGVATDYYLNNLPESTVMMMGGVVIGLVVGLAGLAIVSFALVVIVKMTLKNNGNGNGRVNYVQPQQIPPVYLMPPTQPQFPDYRQPVEYDREPTRRFTIVGDD